MNVTQYDLEFDPQLIDEIYKLKETVPTKKRSNRGGWQSPFYDLFSHPWADPTVIKVMNAVDYTGPVTYWFNVNGSGHFNDWHDHGDFGKKLSACLYLQTPPKSGNIEFKQGKVVRPINPRPGLLVTFANNIMHRVEVNSSMEDRITMAFNFWRM